MIILKFPVAALRPIKTSNLLQVIQIDGMRYSFYTTDKRPYVKPFIDGAPVARKKYTYRTLKGVTTVKVQP